MCGIGGVAAFGAAPRADEALIRRMCATMRHRGPDDEGHYFDDHVGLGMRRLSIIDLATGRQPVTNEDGTVCLVFNGEIYNYRELRGALLAKGHTFRSHGDAEVIVHAYEEYGDQCVDHFNGIFAFAVWDRTRRRLLMARDRLGVKPLYYWQQNGLLVFGSELKALLAHPAVPREIDPVALDQYLTLEYVPAPRSILRGVLKLPAGHRLIFQEGKLSTEGYWDARPVPVPEGELECAEALAELIDDSVRMQLASDVPLGAFLSGGIDSSTIVASMGAASLLPVRSFSIGFEDSTYDELPFARLVAQHCHTEHHEEILRPDFGALAELLIAHLDEPIGDFSILPTYLVSKVASKSVKVVLSGDGGDELFGGYESYVAQRMDRFYRWLPRGIRQTVLPSLADRIAPRPEKKGFVNKAKRFVEGAALPPSLQHARWMVFLSDAHRASLYRPELQDALEGHSPSEVFAAHFERALWPDELARQQYVDIKTYLADDILAKVDRVSMAASIEARVPLLDHRIVEFAVSLPARMKLHGGQTKRVLRRAMAGRLPEAVLNKPKQGFSFPLKHWLLGPLRPLMLDLLAADSIRRRGYFEPAQVEQWVSEHLRGSANHSHRLWAIMVFELWHQKVLDSRELPASTERAEYTNDGSKVGSIKDS